jgi:hypothetical protein
MPFPDHRLGPSVERTKKTLEGLPDLTKELLEKVNKKYGYVQGALRETTRETTDMREPQELNLHLEVD